MNPKGYRDETGAPSLPSTSLENGKNSALKNGNGVSNGASNGNGGVIIEN